MNNTQLVQHLRKHVFAPTVLKAIVEALQVHRNNVHIETEDDLFIKWHRSDVMGRALDMGRKRPTVQQQRDVLELLRKTHDCNDGITWESIDQALEVVTHPNKNNLHNQ